MESHTDIERRFLEDHARLRAKADVLEALALRVLRGDEDLGSALRLKGEEIHHHLLLHMEWEEHTLAPILRAPESALAAAEKLAEEHRRQREQLGTWLESMTSAEPKPLQLARHVLELIRWLEQDMAIEEAAVLQAIGSASERSTDDGEAR